MWQIHTKHERYIYQSLSGAQRQLNFPLEQQCSFQLNQREINDHTVKVFTFRKAELQTELFIYTQTVQKNPPIIKSRKEHLSNRLRNY
jgi:hypothetical protein